MADATTDLRVAQEERLLELRADLALLTGLPDVAIDIVRLEAAGCYGRNGADDVAADAALLGALRADAEAIRAEDVAMCDAIGRYGLEIIPDGARVLTHCNAGALATAGIGTALAP